MLHDWQSLRMNDRFSQFINRFQIRILLTFTLPCHSKIRNIFISHTIPLWNIYRSYAMPILLKALPLSVFQLLLQHLDRVLPLQVVCCLVISSTRKLLLVNLHRELRYVFIFFFYNAICSKTCFSFCSKGLYHGVS